MKTVRYLFFLFFLFISCGDEETPTGPIANFGYTIDNLIVSFSDSSTAGDAVINRWVWDFGDGSTSTEKNPIHTYSEDGTYLVTLKVYDENVLSDVTAPRQIVLESQTIGPTANFSYTSNYLIVSFVDASTPGNSDINNWSWDFDGDGVNDTSGVGPHTYTYASPGTYTVSLTVTDENNLTSSKETDVTVEEYTETGPAASFSFSANFLEVTFTDISAAGNGEIITWSWDFGDGSTSTEQNPIHTFEEDGTYSVSLTVTDENSLVDTYTGSIVVSATATFISLAPEYMSINLDINVEHTGELILQVGNLSNPIYGISLRIAYDSSNVVFMGATEYEN